MRKNPKLRLQNKYVAMGDSTFRPSLTDASGSSSKTPAEAGAIWWVRSDASELTLTETSKVTVWNDKIGTNDLDTVAAGRQNPRYGSGYGTPLNGFYPVRFTYGAENSHLYKLNPSGFPVGNYQFAFTLFTVFAPPSTSPPSNTDYYGFYYGRGHVGDGAVYNLEPSYNGGPGNWRRRVNSYPNYWLHETGALPDTNPRIKVEVCPNYGGANSYRRINGLQTVTGARPTASGLTSSTMYMGIAIYPVTGVISARGYQDVYEMAFFDSPISLTTVQQLEAYASARYGIALS